MSLSAAQIYRLNHMNRVSFDALLGDAVSALEAANSGGALADGHLLVGSALGVATDVAVTGDIAITNAGVTSIASGVIINADIKSDAAIALSKIACATGSIVVGAAGVASAVDAKTSGQILVGSGTTLASVAVSGDVTMASTGAVTIGAGKVLETMLKVQTADGLHAKRIARATFDFASHATVGAHGLGVTLPANSVITRSWYDVQTTFTSATGDSATVALSCQSADNILAAVAISNGANAWDQGMHEGISTGTVANMKKLTTGGEITATIAVEDITAGKLVVFVEYVVTDVNA